MTGSNRTYLPNPAQEAAVAHGPGPLRILAGAGSGKTTTLVRRILQLIADGRCRPSEVLMLTFTKKAAGEMRERVAAALPAGSEQPRIETYHAFALSLVQEFAAELGLPDDPILLTPGPVKLFTRRQIDRLSIHHLDLIRLNEAVAAILDFFDWHRHEGSFLLPDSDLLAQVEEAGREPLAELLEAQRRYRALLVEQGAVDYDDLIAQSVALLEGHPDVREALQTRYPYILVDEYQDTDYLQGRFIHLLAGERGNITIVGDPDQTIYGFRGATVTNILDFHQLYPAVKTVPMMTNYRSTPAILAAANAVIANNQRRKAEALEPGREQGDLPIPQGIEAPDWESEAAWLAQEALRLHQDEGIDWQDMAVLVRLNRHKLLLYAALTDAGIPVVMAGGMALLDDPETTHFVGYLQALAQPSDDASLALALSLPRYGVTDGDLAQLVRARVRGERLLDVAERQMAQMPALKAFFAEFWPIYRLQHAEGCEAAIRAALRLHSSSLGRQARLNADELLTLAQGFFAQSHLLVDPADATPPLGQFCQYLTDLRDLREDPEGAAPADDDEGVRLMTIHAVKGLEFPVVFLPRLVEGDFPKGYRRDKGLFPAAWRHEAEEDPAAAQLEEERRAFYVAVTRARDRLYLSWAPNDPARKKPLERSGFLDELGETVAWQTLPGNEAGGLGEDAGVAADEAAVALPEGLAALVSKAPARPLPSAEPDTPFVAGPLKVLSFSHLATYQYCPLRFFLTYVVRLPGRPTTTADAGVRIHAAAERLGEARRAGEAVAFEAFSTWAAKPQGLAEAEAEAGGEQESERDKLYPDVVAGDEATALRNYWQSEYGQTAPLASEQEFYVRLGDVVVRGFIDRIHQRADGSVEVVDFKTYNRLLTEGEVRQSLQLPLYIRACHAALGLKQVDTAAMYFLKHDVTVRVRYTPEELAERLREAERLVEAIEAGDWAPTPSKQGCGWCPFGEICPVSAADLAYDSHF